MSWEEICQLARKFTCLTALTASSNELSSLSSGLLPTTSASNLTSLTLEYNNFTALSDLAPLVELKSLERLILKGNQIIKVGTGEGALKLQFGENLRHVDLSFNSIDSWELVDRLEDIFPGLTSLRVSHNPFYEGVIQQIGAPPSLEEAYMLTLARLGKLKSLNFSNVTPTERTNAEMFYLSRIGQEMAKAPESLEHTIIAKHKRFNELCQSYGAPPVVRVRAETINPNFLEARLIKFTFVKSSPNHSDITKLQEIPKGFDVYRMKGMVGKVFGLHPSKIRLIWETGEWDPVAGYEDDENSSDDDDDDARVEVSLDPERAKGQWMKREVELEDSTRQIGFCVDGMEARVRVEVR